MKVIMMAIATLGAMTTFGGSALADVSISITANTDQTRHKTTYRKGSKQMPQ
jgi:hypothetical protein